MTVIEFFERGALPRYAAASGLTQSETVARAIARFLAQEREHG